MSKHNDSCSLSPPGTCVFPYDTSGWFSNRTGASGDAPVICRLEGLFDFERLEKVAFWYQLSNPFGTTSSRPKLLNRYKQSPDKASHWNSPLSYSYWRRRFRCFITSKYLSSNFCPVNGKREYWSLYLWDSLVFFLISRFDWLDIFPTNHTLKVGRHEGSCFQDMLQCQKLLS